MSYARRPRRAQTAADFEFRDDWRQDGQQWTCLVCTGTTPFPLSDALKHEKRDKHKEARRRALARSSGSTAAAAAVPLLAEPSELHADASHQTTSSADAVAEAWARNLRSFADGSGDFLDALVGAHEAHLSRLTSGASSTDAVLDNDDNFYPQQHDSDDEFRPAAERDAAAQLAKDLFRRDHRDDPEVNFSSEDEACERPPSQVSSDTDEDAPTGSTGSAAPRQNLKRRAETAATETSNPWFPWSSKPECSLDALLHLRRSGFSREQIKLLTWFSLYNGAQEMPSERQMRDLDKFLQDLCGVRTVDYVGAMGNRFSVNSLADMLAQEWANPRVRPHLHDLPEDAGQTLEEAWQTQRWLSELPDHLTTPMVRIGGSDYFIFEPVLLNSLRVCMPHRWFTRRGQLFAKTWPMTAFSKQHSDGTITDGWHVHEYESVEVPASELLLS